MPRISVVWQYTDPSAESIRSTPRASDLVREMYRGLTLDGELVIDHLWQFPGAEKNRLRFVYFGYENGRRHFARRYSIDQTRVIHYERAEEQLRGRTSPTRIAVPRECLQGDTPDTQRPQGDIPATPQTR